MSKRMPLLPLVRSFFEKDPVQAARSLETMTEEEALQALASLPAHLTVKVFPHLPLSYAARVLTEVSPELFEEIVRQLDPKQGADIFRQAGPETCTRLLEILPEKMRRTVQELLVYPPDSAGRMLSTDFLALHMDLKVKDAIYKIRQLARKGAVSSYAYVVDAEDHLVGVMNMRDLILASGEETLAQVTRKDFFAVDGFMDKERVAQELSTRKFFAVPVVDGENRLLGIVRADQLIEDAEKEATEDLQKMFGAGGDERVFSPVRFSLKMRLPWLYVNLATAFLAAGVVALFEGIIAKITVLAVFMPVVAGQGGNAGAQSLAVVMRGLVMREIPKDKRMGLILKESWIGILNGLAVGTVTGLVAWAWQGNPMLGLVVGMGMLVNLFVAGMTGAAIPLTMKMIGLDPAQCSNIILTTFTDVIGFLAFLGLAVVFQSYLI